MLFVTGDVHHESLATRDQRHLSESEVDLAREYARIAGEYDVTVTLFVSGKTAVERPEAVRALARRENVELGGHNWDCFERSWLHYLWELALDTHYGPERYQRWDIRKTLDVLEDVTGERPTTWRSHAYVEDDRTHGVLADAGVDVVSNAVGPEEPLADGVEGLLSLPINTTPDHAHVYHGWLSEAYVERQNRLRRTGPSGLLRLGRFPTRDELVRASKETAKLLTGSRRRSSFENEWFNVEDWRERLESEVRDRREREGFATVLAHPACMELADGMASFEHLCAFASDLETAPVSEAPSLL